MRHAKTYHGGKALPLRGIMAAKPCPGRLCSSSKLPSRGRARKQQRIFQRSGPCGLTGEGNPSMLVPHCNHVTGTRHGQHLTVAKAATSGKHMTAIATSHRPMRKQAAATNLPSREARVYNPPAAETTPAADEVQMAGVPVRHVCPPTASKIASRVHVPGGWMPATLCPPTCGLQCCAQPAGCIQRIKK